MIHDHTFLTADRLVDHELMIKWLQKHLTTEVQEFDGGEHKFELKVLSPHITCNDGTTLSVQTGSNSYCLPRKDTGPWEYVEVGYPSSSPPESWSAYKDGENSPVWAYVPIYVVAAFIWQHGGVREVRGAF